jgi:hypothetical protein
LSRSSEIIFFANKISSRTGKQPRPRERAARRQHTAPWTFYLIDNESIARLFENLSYEQAIVEKLLSAAAGEPIFRQNKLDVF